MLLWRPGTVPELWIVQPLLNFSRVTSAKAQDPLPDFSISFNNFTVRMKMCFFMNEKFQLLDLAAEISKNPRRVEHCLAVVSSYFPLACPIKWGGARFQKGCLQEIESCSKTRKILLGDGEKSPPSLVLFQFGSFKKQQQQIKPHNNLEKYSSWTYQKVTSNNLSIA